MEGIKTPRWRRRVVGLLAAVGLAAAGTVVVAAPANAAPGGCASGATCLWTAPYFVADGTGSPYTYLPFQNCIDNLAWFGYANTVSSVFNNGNTDTVYLYTGTYKTGSLKTLARNSGIGRLADYAGFNDNLESTYFVSNLGDSHTSTCA